MRTKTPGEHCSAEGGGLWGCSCDEVLLQTIFGRCDLRRYGGRGSSAQRSCHRRWLGCRTSQGAQTPELRSPSISVRRRAPLQTYHSGGGMFQARRQERCNPERCYSDKRRGEAGRRRGQEEGSGERAASSSNLSNRKNCDVEEGGGRDGKGSEARRRGANISGNHRRTRAGPCLEAIHSCICGFQMFPSFVVHIVVVSQRVALSSLRRCQEESSCTLEIWRHRVVHTIVVRL